MKKRPLSCTVIGIISIAFSIAGLFISLNEFKGFNLPFQLLIESIKWGSIAVPKLNILANVLQMSLFDYFFSVILIISGIGTILVKPWGRMLARIYALSIVFLSIVISVLCIPIYIWKLVLLVFNRWEPIIQLDWFTYAGGGMTYILMLLSSLLYPIILLIFFSRPKIKEKFAVGK